MAPHIQAMWEGLDEGNLNKKMVSKAWHAALIIMIWELKGYGILLRGADMDCHHNQVEARGGCGSSALGSLLWGTDTLDTAARTARRYDASAIARNPSPISLFSVPALGGIWQISNLLGLFADMLRLGKENKYSVYHRILITIAYLILIKSEARS